MFAKAVRTVFTIVGTVVIIGAVVIGVMMAMGKRPLPNLFDKDQVDEVVEVKMTLDEDGLEVVDTNSLRSNILVEKDGVFMASPQFIDTIQKYRYAELNEAAPELVNHTSIQDPEVLKKFEAEVIKDIPPAFSNVTYNSALSSEAVLVDLGDTVGIINQSTRPIVVKGITVPSEFTIEPDQFITTVYHYLGEFIYEVDGKTFTVVVKTRS